MAASDVSAMANSGQTALFFVGRSEGTEGSQALGARAAGVHATPNDCKTGLY